MFVSTTPARVQRRLRARLGRVLRIAVLISLLGGLLAVLPMAASSASTPVPDVSHEVDPSNLFPSWYQDASGVRLAPCLDIADSNCVLAGDASYDPASPLAFPGNFPEEFFYAEAQSTRLTTPGCKGTKPGRIDITVALEGAFTNGAPAYGDQMVFGRTRLTVAGGLCAGSTYHAVYPYGELDFTTDNNGGLAKTAGTTDVGCAPVAPNACDFRLALTSKVATSFLRWDPAVAPQAPDGYLGDATTAHRVTGATFTPAGASAPANYFEVTGPRLDQPLRTDTFTVSGKKAGPLAATPTRVDFAGHEAGTTSDPREVTIRSWATAEVHPTAARVEGADAGAFGIVSDECAAATLVQDSGHCRVSLDFRPAPTAHGPLSARLVVGHDAYGQPLSVPLSGTATGGDEAPGIATSVSSVDFGEQRINYSSTSRTVKVTNDGTAPLVVSGVEVTGGDAGEYSATSHCTGSVAPGDTCTVTATFAPTTAGDHASTLRLTSNAASSPTELSLTGRGFGGRAAVSETVEANGFPTWYQDERGVRIEQCIDPDDPNCIVLPGGTYTGAGDISFPDSFPDEFFWGLTDSEELITPGCNGGESGRALFRFVMEAAFVNGDPVPHEQMSFGRVRVRANGGLCPDTTYRVVTPYGEQEVTTDGDGALKPSPNTSDIGCAPAGASDPCDFGLALRSPIAGGFLRWDPDNGPAAPAGYLGDPSTPHRVVGAPYTVPGETAPANYVAIYRGNQLIAKTDKFLVMGKLGGPLVADPSPTTFGGLHVGDPGASRTVTLANQGFDPLTVNGFEISGAAAGSYEVGASTCGLVLIPGDDCSVEVTFAPTDQGPLSANLVVDHTGLNSPMNVKLSGVGLAPEGTAALSVDKTSLAFAQLHTGRTSSPRKLVVSNVGGTAPLTLGNMEVSGPAESDFDVTPGTCTGPVAVDASCTLEVRFKPTADGERGATLTVNAPDASPASREVSLSATGFDGERTVAATQREDGYPTYYQDQNGVRLVPCLDPADGGCVLTGGAGYDPELPLSVPDNFPEEFFYTASDSEPVTVTDDSCGASGDVSLHTALEGAFANGAPEAGQQITFGRTRVILVGSLCPDTEYTFVTPFGEQRFTTDADGSLRRTDATNDVGCGGAPCSFADALPADVLDGFLRWTPGVGAPAPAGHLGDGVSFHQVVGGTYLPGGATEPVNYFEVKNGSTSLGRADKFSVLGKIATGLVADGPVLFGDQPAGTATTRTLTVTNIGDSPVTVANATVVGAQDGVLTVTGGTCTTAPVAGGDTCTVVLRFAPTATGSAIGTLQLQAAGDTVLLTDGVSGTGLAAQGIAEVTPTAVTMAPTRVSTLSPFQLVTVRNTGSARLSLATPVLDGDDPGDFTATPLLACGNVLPGASCTVRVRFAPTAPGARTATLRLPSNGFGPVPEVALSGVGTAPRISSVPLTMGNLRVGQTATKLFTITNSGDASLHITDLKLAGDADFSAGVGTCNRAVASGSSCRISITFAAHAPTGAKSTMLTFVSDAVDAPQPEVTGTATASEITSSASVLDMRTVKIGLAVTKGFLVTNTGTAPLNIGAVNLAGASDFTATRGTCTHPIAPGGTCRISVTFTPTAPGGARSATLSFVSDALSSPVLPVIGRAAP